MPRAVAILALLSLAASAQAAAPVCALLDPEKAPQAALLEAKLLGDPAATWVERANVDAVLKEQMLQRMFSPQGVGDRVKLGKLLKADLLVMVRPVKDAKEPALEVVISETAGGLRLLIRGVAITENADADVAALHAAVSEGIAKHGEKVKEVIAVPPFVSNDFEYAFDHLKGAFAKLAEAEALDRPGVVVVELEEAQAVAKELALAGNKLDRPLPIYLLGEYRHEGKEKNRTLTLKLRAERGGKPVGKELSQSGKTDEGPAAVRTWSAETLGAILKDEKPRPAADPKAEARQLAERASIFRRLGNWSEASELFEAALLLEPDSPDLLAAAILPLSRIAQKLAPGGPTPAAIQKLRSIQFLGMSHIESLIVRDDALKAYRDRKIMLLAGEFMFAVRQFSPFTKRASWPRRELEELHEAQRQASLRLIPPTARAAVQAELVYIADALSHLPTHERYLLAERILNDLGKIADRRVLANLTLRAAWLWKVHYFELAKAGEEETEYRSLLARLESGKDETIREAAHTARLALDDELKKSGKPIPASTRGVHFSIVNFVREPDGYPVAPPHGVLAIGPKLDVVWNAAGLYLMKEKGKLRPVWTTDEDSFRFRSVIFDGRYVWAASSSFKNWPFLLVLDPETGKVRQIDERDGLPAGTAKQLEKLNQRYALIAPIAPGSVCAAGSFGRAWIAVITFDPASNKPSVKVVHEAREAPEPFDEKQGLKTTVDFVPAYMFPIAAENGKDVRIAIGRSGAGREEQGSNSSVEKFPLVFNPATQEVTTLKEEYVQSQPVFPSEHFVAANGRVYTVVHSRGSFPDARIDLLGLDLPGPKPTIVGNAGPKPVLFSRLDAATRHNDRLLFIWNWYERPKTPSPNGTTVEPIRDLWSINFDGTDGRLLAENVPPIITFHQSAHLGLLAVFRAGGRVEMHRMTIGSTPAALHASKLPSEKTAKSMPSTVAARFTIRNSSGKSIRLFWLDLDGNRQLYKELAPGERFEQKTFVDHVWLVADADDNAWRLIRPEPQSLSFEIAGPEKK